MRRPSISKAVLPEERTSWTSRPNMVATSSEPGDVGDRSGVDSPTVTQDGHLIAQLEYFIEVVTHVEQGDTVVAEDSNHSKQLFNFVGTRDEVGSSRITTFASVDTARTMAIICWTATPTEPRGQPLIDGDAVPAKKTGGIGIHLLDIDQSEPAHWLPTEEQVLGDVMNGSRLIS